MSLAERAALRPVILALAFVASSLPGHVVAEENAPAEKPAEAGAPATEVKPADTPPPAKPKIDVRKLFATNCSWCHQDYGMRAADGPKLAGTSLTEEQVIQQITRGKTPMPGFRKILTPEQIEALAKYIKSLKDPGN